MSKTARKTRQLSVTSNTGNSPPRKKNRCRRNGVAVSFAMAARHYQNISVLAAASEAQDEEEEHSPAESQNPEEIEERFLASQSTRKGKGKAKAKSKANAKNKESLVWKTNGSPPPMTATASALFFKLCNINTQANSDTLTELIDKLLHPSDFTPPLHVSIEDCTLVGIISQCRRMDQTNMEFDFYHMINLLKLGFQVSKLLLLK